jgi:hypothetical protein
MVTCLRPPTCIVDRMLECGEDTDSNGRFRIAFFSMGQGPFIAIRHSSGRWLWFADRACHGPKLGARRVANGTKYWVRLAVHTAVVFTILATNFRPRPSPIRFWTLFAALLLLHLVCCVWFILEIRPLGAIHYIAFGPFEVLLLALLLKWGTRYLELDQADD